MAQKKLGMEKTPQPSVSTMSTPKQAKLGMEKQATTQDKPVVKGTLPKTPPISDDDPRIAWDVKNNREAIKRLNEIISAPDDQIKKNILDERQDKLLLGEGTMLDTVVTAKDIKAYRDNLKSNIDTIENQIAKLKYDIGVKDRVAKEGYTEEELLQQEYERAGQIRWKTGLTGGKVDTIKSIEKHPAYSWVDIALNKDEPDVIPIIDLSGGAGGQIKSTKLGAATTPYNEAGWLQGVDVVGSYIQSNPITKQQWETMSDTNKLKWLNGLYEQQFATIAARGHQGQSMAAGKGGGGEGEEGEGEEGEGSEGKDSEGKDSEGKDSQGKDTSLVGMRYVGPAGLVSEGYGSAGQVFEHGTTGLASLSPAARQIAETVGYGNLTGTEVSVINAARQSQPTLSEANLASVIYSKGDIALAAKLGSKEAVATIIKQKADLENTVKKALIEGKKTDAQRMQEKQSTYVLLEKGDPDNLAYNKNLVDLIIDGKVKDAQGNVLTLENAVKMGAFNNAVGTVTQIGENLGVNTETGEKVGFKGDVWATPIGDLADIAAPGFAMYITKPDGWAYVYRKVSSEDPLGRLVVYDKGLKGTSLNTAGWDFDKPYYGENRRKISEYQEQWGEENTWNKIKDSVDMMGNAKLDNELGLTGHVLNFPLGDYVKPETGLMSWGEFVAKYPDLGLQYEPEILNTVKLSSINEVWKKVTELELAKRQGKTLSDDDNKLLAMASKYKLPSGEIDYANFYKEYVPNILEPAKRAEAEAMLAAQASVTRVVLDLDGANRILDAVKKKSDAGEKLDAVEQRVMLIYRQHLSNNKNEFNPEGFRIALERDINDNRDRYQLLTSATTTSSPTVDEKVKSQSDAEALLKPIIEGIQDRFLFGTGALQLTPWEQFALEQKAKFTNIDKVDWVGLQKVLQDRIADKSKVLEGTPKELVARDLKSEIIATEKVFQPELKIKDDKLDRYQVEKTKVIQEFDVIRDNADNPVVQTLSNIWFIANNANKLGDIVTGKQISIPPIPKVYRLNEEFDKNDPTTVWREFYRDYQISPELQQYIYDSGHTVVKRLESFAEGGGEAGLYSDSTKEIITKSDLNSINSKLIAHEVGHLLFAQLSEQERNDFINKIKQLTQYDSVKKTVEAVYKLKDLGDYNIANELFADMVAADNTYGLNLKNKDDNVLISDLRNKYASKVGLPYIYSWNGGQIVNSSFVNMRSKGFDNLSAWDKAVISVVNDVNDAYQDYKGLPEDRTDAILNAVRKLVVDNPNLEGLSDDIKEDIKNIKTYREFRLLDKVPKPELKIDEKKVEQQAKKQVDSLSGITNPEQREIIRWYAERYGLSPEVAEASVAELKAMTGKGTRGALYKGYPFIQKDLDWFNSLVVLGHEKSHQMLGLEPTDVEIKQWIGNDENRLNTIREFAASKLSSKISGWETGWKAEADTFLGSLLNPIDTIYANQLAEKWANQALDSAKARGLINVGEGFAIPAIVQQVSKALALNSGKDTIVQIQADIMPTQEVTIDIESLKPIVKAGLDIKPLVEQFTPQKPLFSTMKTGKSKDLGGPTELGDQEVVYFEAMTPPDTGTGAKKVPILMKYAIVKNADGTIGGLWYQQEGKNWEQGNYTFKPNTKEVSQMKCSGQYCGNMKTDLQDGIRYIYEKNWDLPSTALFVPKVDEGKKEGEKPTKVEKPQDIKDVIVGPNGEIVSKVGMTVSQVEAFVSGGWNKLIEETQKLSVKGGDGQWLSKEDFGKLSESAQKIFVNQGWDALNKAKNDAMVSLSKAGYTFTFGDVKKEEVPDIERIVRSAAPELYNQLKVLKNTEEIEKGISDVAVIKPTNIWEHVAAAAQEVFSPSMAEHAMKGLPFISGDLPQRALYFNGIANYLGTVGLLSKSQVQDYSKHIDALIAGKETAKYYDEQVAIGKMTQVSADNWKKYQQGIQALDVWMSDLRDKIPALDIGVYKVDPVTNEIVKQQKVSTQGIWVGGEWYDTEHQVMRPIPDGYVKKVTWNSDGVAETELVKAPEGTIYGGSKSTAVKLNNGDTAYNLEPMFTPMPDWLKASDSIHGAITLKADELVRNIRESAQKVNPELGVVASLASGITKALADTGLLTRGIGIMPLMMKEEKVRFLVSVGEAFTTSGDKRKEILTDASGRGIALGTGIISFFVDIPQRVKKDPLYELPYVITMTQGHALKAGIEETGKALNPKLVRTQVMSIQDDIPRITSPHATPETTREAVNAAMYMITQEDASAPMTFNTKAGSDLVLTLPEGQMIIRMSPLQRVVRRFGIHTDWNAGQEFSKAFKEGVYKLGGATQVGGFYMGMQKWAGRQFSGGVPKDPADLVVLYDKSDVRMLPQPVFDLCMQGDLVAAKQLLQDMMNRGEIEKGVYLPFKWHRDEHDIVELELWTPEGYEVYPVPRDRIPSFAKVEGEGTAVMYSDNIIDYKQPTPTPSELRALGYREVNGEWLDALGNPWRPVEWKPGDKFPIYYAMTKSAIDNGRKFPNLQEFMLAEALATMTDIRKAMPWNRGEKRELAGEEGPAVTSPLMSKLKGAEFKTTKSAISGYSKKATINKAEASRQFDRNDVYDEPTDPITGDWLNLRMPVNRTVKEVKPWDEGGLRFTRVEIIGIDVENNRIVMGHTIWDNAPKDVLALPGGGAHVPTSMAGKVEGRQVEKFIPPIISDNYGAGPKSNALQQLKEETGLIGDPNRTELLGIYAGMGKLYGLPGHRVYITPIVGNKMPDPHRFDVGGDKPSSPDTLVEMDNIESIDFSTNKRVYPATYDTLRALKYKPPEWLSDTSWIDLSKIEVFKGDKKFDMSELLGDARDINFAENVRDGTGITEQSIRDVNNARQQLRQQKYLSQLERRGGFVPEGGTETLQDRISAQHDRVLESYNRMRNLGIAYDPKIEARKQAQFVRELIKLASIYVELGVQSAKEFAEKVSSQIGEKLSSGVANYVWESSRTKPNTFIRNKDIPKDVKQDVAQIVGQRNIELRTIKGEDTWESKTEAILSDNPELAQKIKDGTVTEVELRDNFSGIVPKEILEAEISSIKEKAEPKVSEPSMGEGVPEQPKLQLSKEDRFNNVMNLSKETYNPIQGLLGMKYENNWNKVDSLSKEAQYNEAVEYGRELIKKQGRGGENWSDAEVITHFTEIAYQNMQIPSPRRISEKSYLPNKYTKEIRQTIQNLINQGMSIFYIKAGKSIDVRGKRYSDIYKDDIAKGDVIEIKSIGDLGAIHPNYTKTFSVDERMRVVVDSSGKFKKDTTINDPIVEELIGDFGINMDSFQFGKRSRFFNREVVMKAYDNIKNNRPVLEGVAELITKLGESVEAGGQFEIQVQNELAEKVNKHIQNTEQGVEKRIEPKPSEPSIETAPKNEMLSQTEINRRAERLEKTEVDRALEENNTKDMANALFKINKLADKGELPQGLKGKKAQIEQRLSEAGISPDTGVKVGDRYDGGMRVEVIAGQEMAGLRNDTIIDVLRPEVRDAKGNIVQLAQVIVGRPLKVDMPKIELDNLRKEKSQVEKLSRNPEFKEISEKRLSEINNRINELEKQLSEPSIETAPKVEAFDITTDKPQKVYTDYQGTNSVQRYINGWEIIRNVDGTYEKVGSGLIPIRTWDANKEVSVLWIDESTAKNLSFNKGSEKRNAWLNSERVREERLETIPESERVSKIEDVPTVDTFTKIMKGTATEQEYKGYFANEYKQATGKDMPVEQLERDWQQYSATTSKPEFMEFLETIYGKPQNEVERANYEVALKQYNEVKRKANQGDIQAQAELDRYGTQLRQQITATIYGKIADGTITEVEFKAHQEKLYGKATTPEEVTQLDNVWKDYQNAVDKSKQGDMASTEYIKHVADVDKQRGASTEKLSILGDKVRKGIASEIEFKNYQERLYGKPETVAERVQLDNTWKEYNLTRIRANQGDIRAKEEIDRIASIDKKVEQDFDVDRLAILNYRLAKGTITGLEFVEYYNKIYGKAKDAKELNDLNNTWNEYDMTRKRWNEKGDVKAKEKMEKIAEIDKQREVEINPDGTTYKTEIGKIIEDNKGLLDKIQRGDITEVEFRQYFEKIMPQDILLSEIKRINDIKKGNIPDKSQVAEMLRFRDTEEYKKPLGYRIPLDQREGKIHYSIADERIEGYKATEVKPTLYTISKVNVPETETYNRYNPTVYKPTKYNPTTYQPSGYQPTGYETTKYPPTGYPPTTKYPPVPPITPPVTPPSKPPAPPEKKRTWEGLTPEERTASIVWKQGFYSWAISPPYRQEDLIGSSKPFAGTKVHSGPLAAYKSVAKVKGDLLPEKIQINLGTQDLEFIRDRYGKDVIVRYKLDPAYIGAKKGYTKDKTKKGKKEKAEPSVSTMGE